MKDASGGQSCLKSVCNRTIRPPSFTDPPGPRGSAAKEGVETVEETVRRRRSTAIIYQFRILMSERLIQKASTLRKPKRSTLLSLPGGWPPSPLFLPLASDTLCYSRMISDSPPPPFTVLSIRVLSLYLHFFFAFLLYYPIIHLPLFVILFLQCKYFCCYSSIAFLS